MKGELSTQKKAEMLNLPVINLFEKRPVFESLMLVPEEISRKKRLLVFDVRGDFAEVAAENPLDKEIFAVLDFIRKKTGKPIQLFVSSKESIDYGLVWYEDLKLDQKSREAEAKEKEKKDIEAEKKLSRKNANLSFSSIYDVLDHAIKIGVSNVHIECRNDKAKVLYHLTKIHGVTEVTEARGRQFIHDIKMLAHIEEDQIEDSGEFSMLKGDKYFHIIVTFSPLPVGIRANIEIAELDDDRFQLSWLSMDRPEVALVEKTVAQMNSGIITVTGPNGSGRTATMYALLRLFMKKKKKIGTVENPIECLFDGVYQKEVSPQDGVTYIAGLREVIKIGAEVVMIEGARDFETIEMIFRESERGKIIILALHEKSLSDALTHFEKMGISKERVANNVKLVINQRLILKLCKNCRRETHLEDSEKEEMERTFRDLPSKANHSNIKTGKFMHSHCMLCNETGFTGHAGLFETLIVDKEARDAILSEKIIEREKEIIFKQGTSTLYQDGLKKVSQGVTTMDEVLRVK